MLAVAGAAFVVLAVAAVAGPLPFDPPVREAVLGLASPPVMAAMRVVNYAGNRWVLAPAVVLLLVVFPHARRRWWVWVALMLVAPAVEGALKELIARPRPEHLGPGFPSGHATAAAAYFGAVFHVAGGLRAARLRRALQGLALAAAALVALARVVLRAHWPSDALGGLALGLALASAAALVAAPQPAADDG
jgi:undecaprenyl-diphosphatase